jgi:hypothetical protein
VEGSGDYYFGKVKLVDWTDFVAVEELHQCLEICAACLSSDEYRLTRGHAGGF